MAAIVSITDYETYLGADTGDTVVAALHSGVERAVKRFLGYDPVQASRTEFLPLGTKPGLRGSGTMATGRWETQGGRAVLHGGGGGRAADHIQLRHLPIRGQPTVYEDIGAQFGSKSGSFAAATQLTYGTDFWMAVRQLDGDSSELCTDGILIRSGSWPIEPGTVKVTYTAGWTTGELNYDMSSEPSSLVDASDIALACKTLMSKAYKTRTAHRVDRTGSPGGIVFMERMGDYMYQIDAMSARSIAGFAHFIPGEVAELLSPFRNMGILVAA